MRAEMKSFAERNRLAIGTVGIVVVAAVALAALQYQRLPFFNQGTRVSAYFADAGGLRTGNTVEVPWMLPRPGKAMSADPTPASHSGPLPTARRGSPTTWTG